LPGVPVNVEVEVLLATQSAREKVYRGATWDAAFGLGVIVSTVLIGLVVMADPGNTAIFLGCVIGGAFSLLKGFRALAKQ
jgi:hypothetical protein